MSPASEPGAALPSPALPRAEVLWIGDHCRGEFWHAWQALNGQTQLHTARTIDDGISRLGADANIELIVLAQAFPDEFTSEQVEALRRVNPLPGMVALLGSWCEGQSRSGVPWPGVPRLYWHQFVPWLDRQLALRALSKPPQWTQPPTTSEEERFLAASERPFGTVRGLIAICSDHDDFSRLLADTCRRHGCHAIEFGGNVPLGALRGVRAALWDGDPCDGKPEQLAALVAAVRPSPVIALLSFPRQDQADLCLAAGAATVLSKPLELAELFRLLPSCEL